MKQQKQSGFAHTGIIVIILTFALVGTLGLVFYQNFIQKKETTSNTNNNTKSNKVPDKTPVKADPTASWLSYSNTKYSFSIKYPPTWTYKEYQLGDGAEFSSSNDEIVSVMYGERGTANYRYSFDDYVRIAGPQEIQNYESLESIKEVTTTSGIKGYTVSWSVANFDENFNKTYTTSDITYFPLKNGSTHGQIELTSGLAKNPTEMEYAEMIKTFSYK